jgi:hypothetical protein
VAGRLIIGGPELPKPTTNDLGEAIGLFSFFQLEKDHCTFETDLFGYGQLFSSAHRHCSIVANRAHLQKILRDAMGLATDVDATVLSTLMFSDHAFCSQQNASSTLLLNGCRQVRIDERIRLVNGELVWSAKSGFSRLLDGTPREYESLVDEGVKEIIENVRIAVEHPSFRQVLVHLSGGRDSRMVFGATIHVPHWRERVGLVSHDVPKTQDLSIACGLAGLFGGKFFDGPLEPPTPVSVDHILRLWRSYFFGMYHRMGGSGWSHKGRLLDTITLAGGHGEVMRVFWSPILRKYLLSNPSDSEFAAQFVKENGLWSVYSSEHEGLALDSICETLSQLPGESTAERLDTHYLYFRNRAHFGLRGYSNYQEHMTWFPLMSPHLLKAAASLSYSDRASGRLVRDTMKRLHPALSLAAYDAEPRDGSDWQYSTTSHPMRLALEGDTSDWRSAQARLRKAKAVARLGLELPAEWNRRGWLDSVEQAALMGLEDARGRSSICRDLLPMALADRVRVQFRSGSRAALETASRIMAIHDVAC